MNEALGIVLKVLSAYGLLLAVVGPIGNFLSLVTAIRLRQTTTFVFIGLLAFTDTLSLYFWNINHFTVVFFDLDLESSSLIGCKLGSFLQQTSLESSAWILVLLSVDRFLSVTVTHWKSIYFKPKRALLAGCTVIAAISALNLNVLFTFGFDIQVNGTVRHLCYDVEDPNLGWMKTWSWVHSVSYSYLPFMLILSANALMLFSLRRLAKKSHSPKTYSSTSRLASVITLAFILFTLPGTLASINYSSLAGSGDIGQLLLVLSDDIQFSYHALQFFVLAATNGKFRREFLKVFARDAAPSQGLTNQLTVSKHN